MKWMHTAARRSMIAALAAGLGLAIPAAGISATAWAKSDQSASASASASAEQGKAKGQDHGNDNASNVNAGNGNNDNANKGNNDDKGGNAGNGKGNDKHESVGNDNAASNSASALANAGWSACDGACSDRRDMPPALSGRSLDPSLHAGDKPLRCRRRAGADIADRGLAADGHLHGCGFRRVHARDGSQSVGASP